MKNFISTGLALSLLLSTSLVNATKHHTHEHHHRHHARSHSSHSEETHGLIGIASWYGHESGNRTANGEKFNPMALTAAHRHLPFGTRVKVTNLKNNKSVIVRINDRGPFVRGRIIDLSKYAAKIIEMGGTQLVSLELQ
jgi:rare lipoprotein A